MDCVYKFNIREWASTVADPDLELREGGGGGGAVLIYLPCWPFSLQSFLLFFTQNKGRRGGGGALP